MNVATPAPVPDSTKFARDYSIVGPERSQAIARGLADASWYTTSLSRDQLQRFTARRNAPAVRDTVIWVVLLVGSGLVAHRTWGSPWMIPAFFVYGTLYGSVSDSRWHECGHRTAFRGAWMNDAMYNVASFMVWREAVSWRWSHIRHHSDTIVVGRDPEIAFPRPMKLRRALLECFGLISNVAEFRKIATNVVGRFTPEELDYLPVAERPKAVRTARVYVVAWSAVIAFAVAQRSVEPLMFVIGPSFYGKWLLVAYGITQHAGLAEDTLDHRLNTRTVRMNRLHRYLYWNMNYHVEHHMFPTVPYHALPALHEAVRHDTPPVYPGFTAVYREIWHVYRQQQTVPQHFVDRSTLLPHSNVSPRISSAGVNPTDESVASPPTSDWISVCESSELSPGALKCVEDHGRTYLVARLGNGELRATDGLCTHARVPLCDGALLGGILECPKHNGRFDLLTGKAIGRPVTIDLKVHDARERDGRIEMRART